METLAHYITYKFKLLLQQYKNLTITSVYIGGGTPSIVEAKAYEAVFAEIYPYLQSDAEITIEANPNTLNLEWLSSLKSFGVNRLSLGVQSFDSEKLAFLERDHKEDSIYNALDLAFKVGLENLNVDLIYGTPLCSPKLIESELQRATSLPIQHISAYHLSIEEESRFFDKQKEKFGSIFPKDSNKEYSMESNEEFGGFLSIGHFVCAYLNDTGFRQYEVSNYAKSKPSFKPSLHNLNYWSGKAYLGIGAGAVGCIDKIRTTMPKSLERFLEKFEEQTEILSLEDELLEHLFLGFRSCVGVQESKIPNKKNLALLLDSKKVLKKGEKIYAQDYFLGDEIALFVG